ncbi:MAG: hypothetical protein JO090_10450 [Rhizobacter sp.]|nr:hypothetical protein [Rhizobacter sp.]
MAMVCNGSLCPAWASLTSVSSSCRSAAVALGLALGLAFGMSPDEARGGPVTFAYAGTISQVPVLDPDSPFPLPVDLGTPYTGTYTFDDGAVNQIAGDPTSGSYFSPLGTLKLNLAGLSFVFTGISIGVIDSPGFDFYSVIFSENPSPDIPTGIQLSLSLADYTGTALSSNALPALPPSLSSFDTTNAFFFTDTIGGNQVEVGGSLDALAVPEPPAPLVPVIAAALAASWLARRRARALAAPH